LAKRTVVQYIDLNQQNLISQELKIPPSRQTPMINSLKFKMATQIVQEKIETFYQQDLNFISTDTVNQVKSAYKPPLYLQRTKLIPWSPTLSPIIEENSLDFLENENELSNKKKNSAKKKLDVGEDNIIPLPHTINDPKAEIAIIQTHTKEEHPNQKDIVVQNIENPLPSQVEKIKSLKKSIAPQIGREIAQQQELKLAPTSILNQVDSAYKTPLLPHQTQFVRGGDSPGLSPIVSQGTSHFLDDDKESLSLVRKKLVFEESMVNDYEPSLKVLMPPSKDPSSVEVRKVNDSQPPLKILMPPSKDPSSLEVRRINDSQPSLKTIMPPSKDPSSVEVRKVNDSQPPLKAIQGSTEGSNTSLNDSAVFERILKAESESLQVVFCEKEVSENTIPGQYKNFQGNVLYFGLGKFLEEHKVPKDLNESGLRRVEDLLLKTLQKQTETYPDVVFDLTGLSQDSQVQLSNFMETHYEASEVKKTYFPEHKTEPSRFSAQGFGFSPNNESSEVIDKTPNKYSVQGFGLSPEGKSSEKDEKTPKNYRVDGFGFSPNNESSEVIDKTPNKYSVQGFGLSPEGKSSGKDEKTPKNYRVDGFDLSAENESLEITDKTPKKYSVQGFGLSPNDESSKEDKKTPKNYRVDGFDLPSKNYKTDGFGLASVKSDTLTTPILETNKQPEKKKGFWRSLFNF